MGPYDYEKTEPKIDMRLVGSTSQRAHYEVTFPGPHHLSWNKNNTVVGEYFVPQNVKKVPLAILVHAYGDESVAPCLTLARLLGRQGVAAFVLYLPIHSRRLPETMKKGFAPTSPLMWLDTYQSSVKEVRMIVDWASTREELNPDRIGVAGFSMGGMISLIAMAMDRRIYAGIFTVIGGNMEELSWGGVSKALPVGHTCTREECHAVYCQYPAFINEVKEKRLENVVPARECFLFDPLTFAEQLRGRHIMMINAEQDEIVPRQSVLQLWEACGEPVLRWLPATHGTIYSHNQLISQEITEFLK